MRMLLHCIRKGPCSYEIHANVFMGKVSSWLYLPYFHKIQKREWGRRRGEGGERKGDGRLKEGAGGRGRERERQRQRERE